MATTGDTFQRKEKKYLLTADQCAAVKAGLRAHMRLDDYGATRIDSLYLDTPNRDLISRSLEKPIYKEKLRIRSYGAFSGAETVFVEIKKKFEGIVYKRRVKMSADAARAYCSGALSYVEAMEHFPMEGSGLDNISFGQLQISREIDAFFGRYGNLVPSMLISCLREAWCPVDAEDGDCVDRITFDTDIRYVDLMNQTSAQRCHVTAPDQVVMEIKCAGGYPLWLCMLLSEVGALPRSFSKYGNAYKRILADQGAISVHQSADGKVAVHGIPTASVRVQNNQDMLISPSEGFEAPSALLRAS